MIPKVISTMEAPSAIGVYSQAVRAGDSIYISGQIGLDPDTMQMVSDSVKEQVEQVMKNIQSIASAAGADLASIVKMTVYLKTMDDYAVLNETMQHLLAPPYPARAVVAVSDLPRGALVEMDAILLSMPEPGPIL